MACSEVVLPLLRKGRAQMGRRGPAELGLSPMGADDVRERFGLGEEEGMKTVRGPRLQSRRLRPTQSFRPESSNSISLEAVPPLRTHTHTFIHTRIHITPMSLYHTDTYGPTRAHIQPIHTPHLHIHIQYIHMQYTPRFTHMLTISHT